MVHPTQMNFLLSTTCFSAFVITVFAFAATGLEKIDCERLLRISLTTFSVFGAVIYIFFGWKLIPHDSSNVTVMAVSVPYLVPTNRRDWKRWLAIALILVAIVGSNTSSPMGVACVALTSYFILNGHSKRWMLLAPIPIVTGGLVYGWGKILNDTDRFKAYRAFMGYWMSDDQAVGNILFGYGPGSFETISQVIQQKMMFHLWYDAEGKLKGYLWMHMHSDLLQFIFEYGLIGASLLAVCAFTVWKGLAQFKNERVVFLGCLSAMIFDFPCRYPAVPIILLLLYGLSLQSPADRKL